MESLKIGILASGGGTNLQALIDNAAAGILHAEISFVASDNPESYALERARKHNIPARAIPYRQLIKAWDAREVSWPPDLNLSDVLSKESFMRDADLEKRTRFFISRAVAEARLLNWADLFDFDLLVLAGFMRTLTPYFLDNLRTLKGPYRIMNIHPALLPAFPGRDGYGDTFRYGCKLGGCTVHFVDYGEDSGPIIAQSVFAIEPGDTLEIVKAKGLKLEWETYTRAINLFAAGKITVAPNDMPQGQRKLVAHIHP